MDGDLWAAAAVIDGVRLPYIAPSLGGVESLIEQPTVVSYWDQGPEQRAKIGIKVSISHWCKRAASDERQHPWLGVGLL